MILVTLDFAFKAATLLAIVCLKKKKTIMWALLLSSESC